MRKITGYGWREYMWEVPLVVIMLEMAAQPKRGAADELEEAFDEGF